MSTDLPLRAACIHGRYDAHEFAVESNSDDWQKRRCSGGREVTIDYEAATNLYINEDVELPEGFNMADMRQAVLEQTIRPIIDAAIGDIDDVATGHPC